MPTFNSNAIDINLYKIPGLSEQFVYFNDDIYITNSTTSEDFFKNNLPCDIAQLNPIVAVRGGTGNFQVNDMMVINEHFTKKELLKNGKMLSLKNGLKAVIRTGLQLPSKFTCGFFDPHLPLSFLKSTFEEIQNISQDELKATTYSRFRDARNVSVWLMRYWQLATGKFFIRNNEKLGKFYSLADDKQAEVWATFESKLPKVMCINDSANISNPDATDKKLSEYLDNIFPEKSSYEK